MTFEGRRKIVSKTGLKKNTCSFAFLHMHKIQNLPVIFPLKDIDNYLNYLIDRVSTRFQLLILALQHKQSSYVGVPFDSLHKSNLGWCRLGSVSNALNNRSVISRVSLEIWAHRDHLKMSCWWRWRHISSGDRVWKTESKTLFKKMKRWFDKRMCLSHQLLHPHGILLSCSKFTSL